MSIPVAPPQTEPDVNNLVTAILSALAEVRCVVASELAADRARDGELEMDSQEAIAVIAKLEVEYGRKLARVEDLEPEQVTSAGAIAEVIHHRWSGDLVSGSSGRA